MEFPTGSLGFDFGEGFAMPEPQPPKDDHEEHSEEPDGPNDYGPLRSVGVYKTMTEHRRMRLLSESALDAALDWHFEPGVAYHVATGGQIDNMTLLKHCLKQQRARYVMIATWVMWREDALDLQQLLRRGIVGRFDFYVGEIFKGGYRGCRPVLDEICAECGGRVARFRNHSKVTLVYGERFDVCIESSANTNTNPRHEQMCATVDSGLCDFYKAYYDQINDFDGGYAQWRPWTRGG